VDTQTEIYCISIRKYFEQLPGVLLRGKRQMAHYIGNFVIQYMKHQLFAVAFGYRLHVTEFLPEPSDSQILNYEEKGKQCALIL
jgi:hypothetical protein